MNEFLTLDMLKVFVVAVSITVMLTEFFKDAIDWLFKKLKFHLPTKYVVFGFALIVIFLPLLLEGPVLVEAISTGILNAILLSLTAIKSYDVILERAIAKLDLPPEDALD